MFPTNAWMRNLTLTTSNSASEPVNVTNTLSCPDCYIRNTTGDGVSVIQGTAASTSVGTWSTGQDSTWNARLNPRSQPRINYTRGFGGVAGGVPTGWSAELVMDDGGMVMGGTAANNTLGSATTNFLAPWYGSTFIATNAAANVPIPVGGTLKNFCFATNTTQPANNSMVATVMVNNVASTLVATIALSQTNGTVCDFTHTVALSANDQVAIRVANNANTTSAAVQGWILELLQSSTTFAIGSGGIGALAAGSTNFSSPYVGNLGATEAAVRGVMPRAGTTTKLCIDLSTATAATVVATVMKNGSATGLAVTSTANVTGVTCGTSGGPISWAQGDQVTLRFVQAAGTGSTISGWSIDFQ